MSASSVSKDAPEANDPICSSRLLIAFWVAAIHPPYRSYGVTAYSDEDAQLVLQRAGYEVDWENAKIEEGIRVSDLDQNHVVPNMGVITRRGIWYPNLNSSS